MIEVTDEVLRDWRAAALAGHADAAFNIGLFCDERKDFDNAKGWYGMAAELGDVDAVVNLGLIYFNEEDFVQAEAWFRAGTVADRADAMHMLTMCLVMLGRPGEVLGLCQRAAELGHDVAARKLGLVLLDAGDTETAEIYLRQAATVGDAEAIAGLVTHLRAADRVEEANRWAKRAPG